MSLEFRQRTPAEYVAMVWKNKWLVIIPTIAVTLAVGWVVRKLPNVYESSSLLIVRPATISSNFIGRLNETDLLFRINSINQQVLSRSSLEPLIRRYGLYKEELAGGASVESLVERMQAGDVKVQIDRTREDMPNAFNISFRSRDQTAARSVTAELASKYVNAQLQGVQEESVKTVAFFEQQVGETKAQLDTLDQRRLEFMRSNIEQLPDSGGGLTQRLIGLYEKQKSYASELGRLRDTIAAIENQRSTLVKVREDQINDVIESVTDPMTTPVYAQKDARRSQLRAELQEMLTTLKPKNPDVIAKQAQLDDVESEIAAMVADQKRRIDQKRRQLEARTDPQAAVLDTQLRNYQNELSRQQSQLAQTNAGIAELERRVNAVPGATVAIQQMDRDYNTLKVTYDNLLAKANDARLRAAANADSQGEAIQVVDAASLPEQPIAPKRQMLYAFGLALGLGAGLMLVLAREVPRLLTVQNTKDAEHYTGLPVLVSLPEMLTPREQRRARLRSFTFATAGLALAILSVPALIVVFRFTHVFNILSGVG
jgi:polysaccharide chain length determinant protein (PEP-CTERM system associated)